MNFLRRIFGANFACIRRLATVGCRLPRHLKQIVYCQVLVAALFLFLWLKWNGGKSHLHASGCVALRRTHSLLLTP